MMVRMPYDMDRLLLLGAVFFFAFFTARTNAEDNYVSVLSCKFGPKCTVDNIECADYTAWKCVRQLKASGEFSVVDCGSKQNNVVALREMQSMVVFDWYGETNGKLHASAHRMIVAQSGKATLQYGFVSEIKGGDPMFFSGAATGICRQID